MAVQIPRLDRAQAPSPGTTGRLDVSAPTQTRALATVATATNKALATAVDFIGDMQSKAIDTKGDHLVNIFDREYRERLEGKVEIDPITGETTRTYGLKHLDGDPTEAYSKFDEDMRARIDQLVGEFKGSEAARARIKQKLDNRYTSLYAQRLTAEGYQYDKFRDATAESLVESAKRDAVEAHISSITPGDAQSLAGFNSSLNEIRSVRIRNAIAQGAAREDENGNILYTDEEGNTRRVTADLITQQTIARDFSETITAGVLNLLSARQVGAAETLFDTHSAAIDPINRATLEKKLDDARVEEKALDVYARTQGMTAAQQREQILKTADPRVQREALNMMSLHASRMANLSAQDSKEVYHSLATMVFDKQRSNNPFLNTYELERDPTFSRLIGRVTDPKQREALYAMVESPNVSDEDARAELHRLVGDGAFFNMEYDDMNLFLTKLNKSDRNTFESLWRQHKLETPSEEGSKVSRLVTQAREAFNAVLLRTDTNGRPTKASLRERNDFESAMIKASESLPADMTPSEINQWVQDNLNKRVLDKEKYRPRGPMGVLRSMFGREEVPIEITPPKRVRGEVKGPRKVERQEEVSVKTDFDSLTSAAKNRWGRKYQAEHPNEKVTRNKIRSYYNSLPPEQRTLEGN